MHGNLQDSISNRLRDTLEAFASLGKGLCDISIRRVPSMTFLPWRNVVQYWHSFLLEMRISNEFPWKFTIMINNCVLFILFIYLNKSVFHIFTYPTGYSMQSLFSLSLSPDSRAFPFHSQLKSHYRITVLDNDCKRLMIHGASEYFISFFHPTKLHSNPPFWHTRHTANGVANGCD